MDVWARKVLTDAALLSDDSMISRSAKFPTLIVSIRVMAVELTWNSRSTPVVGIPTPLLSPHIRSRVQAILSWPHAFLHRNHSNCVEWVTRPRRPLPADSWLHAKIFDNTRCASAEICSLHKISLEFWSAPSPGIHLSSAIAIWSWRVHCAAPAPMFHMECRKRCLGPRSCRPCMSWDAVLLWWFMTV